MRSVFITVEGLDGAGKSTVVDFITGYIPRLVKKVPGHRLIRTREPGGTPLAEVIRRTMLDHSYSSETEMLLAYAARFEHVNTLLRPEYTLGNRSIICDRYIDSTEAYQNHDGRLDSLHSALRKELSFEPDLTFYISVEPEVAMKRLEERGLITSADQRFMKRAESMKKVFDRIAYDEPGRVAIIDGNHSPDEVRKQIIPFLHLLYSVRQDGFPT